MKEQDFGACRLFVEADLGIGRRVELSREQAHYLRHVLRLAEGATLRAFNGRDGEWRVSLIGDGRRGAMLEPLERARPQTPPGEIDLLFAPLKHARLDYMVQKSVEMGASRLAPVITRHTQVARVNLERMRANAIEAAEQCGILSLPEITAPAPLAEAVAALETGRWLIFCDEAAEQRDPMTCLRGIDRGPAAVLIGPEGGFAEEERRLLLARPRTLRLSLGPRIIRADTAAVAALAIVQACLGDWSEVSLG
ncbi:16S rRNA (uracil1498-N3)-methyltransferase [Rhizobiales bacterium GAS113]|nr:16S rRNA (uracil1498-N3)-methyltransferase [Rhizobiales bacterium GAS113]